MQHFQVDPDNSIYSDPDKSYSSSGTYKSVCGNFKVTVYSDCDNVPVELAKQFDYKVVDEDRNPTFMESYIGSGIATLIDYGRHKENTDEEIINEVKERVLEFDKGPQLTKFLNDDGKFTTKFAVVCNRKGWSVKPVYDHDRFAEL